MRKIVNANTATRNQELENLIDKTINMFPEAGTMFLKKEFTKRGYKILSSVISEGGFIEIKSPKGDIIAIKITNFMNKEAQYRIWDSKYNLVSDCVLQYIE